MAAASDSGLSVPDSFTLFSFLDEVESRIESLRRQAVTLQQDQASLLLVLDQLKEESLQSAISPGECQELIANMQRLKERCQAVEVLVHTVRDEGQIEALEKVNKLLDELEIEITASDSCTVTVNNRAHSLLNACLPESVGAVDTRFQSMVLGCALDDQKAVRQRLHCLVRRYCSQPSSPCRPPHSSIHDSRVDTIIQANSPSDQSSRCFHRASDEDEEQNSGKERKNTTHEPTERVVSLPDENLDVFRLNASSTKSIDGESCVSASR